MRKGVYFAGIISILLAISSCGRTINEAAIGDQPVALPPPPQVDMEELVNIVPAGAIPAIDQPHMASAREAAAQLSADEQIIGVVINGDARAYPIAILSVHELVNDQIGGEAVAISWCPLCFSAIVFSRQIGALERPLTFAASGKLLNNTLVMQDRESGSLWSQLYGGGIAGDYAGIPLSLFPSLVMEWEAWQNAYPNSLTLSKTETCRQFQCDSPTPYQHDPYASYYASSDAGIVNHQMVRVGDEAPKERLLGVRLGDQQKAYPFSQLAASPPVNDLVAERPILVWFDPKTQTAAAYSRRLNGETLTFRRHDDHPTQLIDLESGSVWSGVSGIAIAGAYQGERLPPIAANSAFAFGWYDYFPDSLTFQAATE